MPSTTQLRRAAAGALIVAASSAALASPPQTRDAFRLRQPAQAGPKETIIVRGSTTWEPIDEKFPARFKAVEPKIDVDMEIPALGSTGGLRALIEGTCLQRGVGLTDANGDGRLDCDVDGDGVIAVPDAVAGGPGKVPTLAQASRAVTAGEFKAAQDSGLDLVAVQAGRDGLAIVVNANNPVGQLSQAQVQNIYLNPAADDWGLYGGTCPDPGRRITVYTRNTNGGTFDSFIDLFMTAANKPAFLARASSGGMVIVPTALDGVAAVASDPCGVFYAGIGDFATEPRVRAVAAYKTIPPGIVPTQTTVQNGVYPFSRGLYVATIGVPGLDSAEGKLIDWLTSRSGQAVMYESGFVPSYDINPLGLTTETLLSQYPNP